jgi:hypothetical protein
VKSIARRGIKIFGGAVSNRWLNNPEDQVRPALPGIAAPFFSAPTVRDGNPARRDTRLRPDNLPESASMAVFKFDPLSDQRWSPFVERHSNASVFHTASWLDCLKRSYGYEPIVYTTSAPGAPLSDGIVLCRVESWLTGRRLVSLPFSDHCQPLLESQATARELFAAIQEDSIREGWRYAEVRPSAEMNGAIAEFVPIETYAHHTLDLTPDLDTLFQHFHNDCVRRKIKRAQRERLVCAGGRSPQLLKDFYGLMLLTRRRHQIPPQPRKWFANLVDCLGESVKIQVACKNQTPVAAILTLQHRDTLTYKFGCSDAAFHQFGGMHLLLWKAIQEAKQAKLRSFDLGRSEESNTGLIAFKDRWGTARTTLTYYSYSNPKRHAPQNYSRRTSWTMRFGRQVFGHVPGNIRSAVGSLFYRHIG